MKRASFFAITATIAVLGLAPPASATHVQCGDTITTYTRLDSDVVCSGTAPFGLLIGADNVRLHLGHFALRFQDRIGGGGNTGVVQADVERTYSGLDIRGGTIEGFHCGVCIETNDSFARGLTVTAGSVGIDLRGDRNQIYLNDVTMTEESFEGGGGPGIRSGTDAYIAFNTVRGIASAPMIWGGGNIDRVVVNRVECAPTPHRPTGIAVTNYTERVVVAQNTVTGCQNGIQAGPESPGPGTAQVRRNVTNDGGVGILVHGPGFLWRNTANGNDFNGMDILGGFTVQENTARDNGGYGIFAGEGAGATDGGGNRASGNAGWSTGIQCVRISCSP